MSIPNNEIRKIEQLLKGISKLEKFHEVSGFTIDISFGGNTEANIQRIEIGTGLQDAQSGKIFKTLVIKCMQESLAWYVKRAKEEATEINKFLEENKL